MYLNFYFYLKNSAVFFLMCFSGWLFNALHIFPLLLPSPLSPLTLPSLLTSLPLFSLPPPLFKSTLCLCFPSFSTPTCWQGEKEKDAALYFSCVLATSPASAHCLWLSLSSQLSPAKGLKRRGRGRIEEQTGAQEFSLQGPQQEQQHKNRTGQQMLFYCSGNY